MSGLSAAQKAERVGPDGFIGASEIASIVGENPWSKPIDVWLEKTGRAEDVPSDPRARVGLRAEALMCDWYAEDVLGPDDELVPGQTVRHGAIPCVGCTPDFLAYKVRGTSIGEIARPTHAMQLKCVGARMAISWPDEGVPPYVECQVQLEAEILQVPRVDVAAYLGGTDWRIIQVHRDEEFGSLMVAAAVDFWRCVTTDRPPPIDGSESWRKYLAARYPKVERQELDMPTPDVDVAAREFLRAKDDEAEAKARAELMGNKLRALIGEGTGYLGGDYVATWSPDKNGKRALRVKRREQGVF